MKKVLLIINPTAGTKKAAKNLTGIVSALNRADFDTRVFVTAKRGDATREAKRLASDVDLIICSGGDGTLNETVTGVMDAGLKTPIGYIPAGSTNDFANSLHLSNDVMKAAKQVIEGSPEPIDVGMFNDRYFTYVASFGAFTKASYATPQNVKNALGHLAYILEGIQELTSLKKEHVKIEIEDEVIEDDFLFGAVCNSTSVGGIITLDPGRVDMSDGQFEILLIRSPKSLPALHECIIALGNKTYNCEMITFANASKIKITASPSMCWTLDGEKADGSETVLIENLKHRMLLVK